MAEIIKYVDTAVYQPKGGSVTPCFGLPGQNLPATYCTVNIVVRVGVDANHDIWVKIASGSIYEDVNASNYHVTFTASRSDFYYYYDSSTDKLAWTGDAIAVEPVGTVVDATSGYFNWTFPTGSDWVKVGNVNTMNGYLWIGGTGTYTVTDPIYPDPVKIQITDWEELIDYFPFSVRKTNDWLSCNRDGGSVQRRISGAWTDQKNNVSTDLEQHSYYRDSGKWVKCEKTGTE